MSSNGLYLSAEDFKQSFDLVPRLAICLYITSSSSEVLLTKRANPPLQDYWHLPGSFLLKHETIDECQQRILYKELGISYNKVVVSLAGVFENISADPRGHVVDAVYHLRAQQKDSFVTTVETSQVAFFDDLPQQVGFNHDQIINQIRSAPVGQI